MFKILTLNKISKKGTDIFPDNYIVSDNESSPDGIMLRSFKMHDMELPKELKAVARCGAGVNNIPLDKCAEKGIVVFNTPGANANAVKELVITALLISSRKIAESYVWTQNLKEDAAKAVEKGKSAFAGPEISGKTLGVIGLGAIGVLVADAASALGMKVIGYDSFFNVNSALKLNPCVSIAKSINEIYKASDYITIHIPYNDATKGIINKDSISKCKDGVRIINLARGELVNNDDIKSAIAEGKVSRYVTDFPNEEVIGVENIVTFPHLGASTPEAEDNCAVMAAMQIRDYLENGNITNSVNYPSCALTASEEKIVVLRRASADADVSAALKGSISLVSANKGDFGCTMVDCRDAQSKIEALKSIEGVISARVIK